MVDRSSKATDILCKVVVGDFGDVEMEELVDGGDLFPVSEVEAVGASGE